MFFRPKNSVAADVIPFYANGKFFLYYLRDYRGANGISEGVEWNLLTTDDFIRFDEQGVALSKGCKDDQDLYVFTGSVIERDGKYYIFYTGHNPHFVGTSKPQEVIMRAESDDLVNWRKEGVAVLTAPCGYEKDDFRDPFVYFDESASRYRMLIAARSHSGEFYRRGRIISAISADLNEWTWESGEFYAPDAYFMHECPDLFKMGEWYYLLFSEFNDKFCTHYKMSRNPDGPWITPDVDTFDNRCFYAAKTACDGMDRYLFGWNPTRQNDVDYGMWQWGGNIVVHKICQKTDGRLYVVCPTQVQEHYKKTVLAVSDEYKFGADKYSSTYFGTLPNSCKISLNFEYRYGGDFGLILNADDEGKQGYFVKLGARYNRLCFVRVPRPTGDIQFMVESERPIEIEKNRRYRLDVYRDGDVVEVYLDGQAMSTRMIDFKCGKFGVYGNFADVLFGDIEVKI